MYALALDSFHNLEPGRYSYSYSSSYSKDQILNHDLLLRVVQGLISLHVHTYSMYSSKGVSISNHKK